MKWHYDSVNNFFHKYFDKLLTENMIVGNEKYIEEYKDEDGTPTELSKHLFPFKKDKLIYLVPSEAVSKLPIMVTKVEKIAYQGNGYRLVTAYKPMKITPLQTMDFTELVDDFAEAKHSNPEHDLLWRLLSIITYVDRVNIRVATNPEFGKDSKLNIINALTGEIGKISNPTIAKMEYLLFNKVLFINEVSGIKSTAKADIEQFILQCGDFNNEYNKRSRATAGTREKYDISNMSLVIAYNDLKQYGDKKEKYFDFMWTNRGAINNRILPFLFNGRIEEDFTKSFDIDKTVKDNYNHYIKFLRALLYYKQLKLTKLKYEPIELHFETERWKRNFAIINKWVDLYSKDEETYKRIITGLYKAHKSYLEMVGYIETDSNSDHLQNTQPSNPIEEYALQKQLKEITDYLDLNGETDIDTLIKATGSSEEIIEKMKEQGLIYEKSGRVNLL